MIMNERLTSTFIPHLRTQFSRGLAVLFTGAGFSKSAKNTAGQWLPSTADLTRELWKIPFGSDEFDPNNKLQDVFDNATRVNPSATKKLIKKLLTVDANGCSGFYSDLLSMPWSRIYTLNVDDLIEKVLDNHSIPRPVRPISATTGHISEFHDEQLSVVHLNGSLSDVPDDITFGRYQYATQQNSDSFYEQLQHDLASRSVVFVGSSLEEGSMWQHFAMRGPRPGRGETELRPRSYLVVPKLNRSKKALLSQFNIEWLEMTAEEFCVQVLSKLDDARAEGVRHLSELYQWTRQGRFAVQRVGDLPRGTSNPTEYLLGAEPEWVDVIHNRVAHRECFQEIIDEIDRIRKAASGSEFLVVSGTAGSGKSSAMMAIAMQLDAEGIPTAWIDCTQFVDIRSIRKALEADPGIRLLCIFDADIYGSRLVRIVENALDVNGQLTIVCECRSTKLRKILDPELLAAINATNFKIPPLGDGDIETILDVLDRENRLGKLKGLSRNQRRRVLRAEAGRQMLVAMYKATHGEDFRDRAIHELDELDTISKFLYGLICVAHAHRFFLTRDEIAIACGDDISAWPRALESLLAGHVIIKVRGDTYKARHREIAQFLYDAMTEQGTIKAVIAALIKIAATKSSTQMNRRERPKRMLVQFVNHDLIKRTVGPDQGRSIYSQFENLLKWDYHYWLHRGALELEAEALGAAENFLNQAAAIEPGDVFVQTELAYLNLKKANATPHAFGSPQLVEEALEALDHIGKRRENQRAYAAHIAGSQGLLWVDKSLMSGPEKQQFLESLLRNVEEAKAGDQRDILQPLADRLTKALLSMAVPRGAGDEGKY